MMLLLHPISFIVLSQFSFISKYFLFLLSSLAHLLRNVLFKFYTLVCFPVSLLLLISIFTPIGHKDNWSNFNLLKFAKICFASYHMIYPKDHMHLFPNVLFALEKNVYSAVFHVYVC